MPLVELTNRPCPSCGAHLDLHIEKRAVTMDDPQRTAPVVRLLVCRACPYKAEDGPPGSRDVKTGGAS